MQICWPFGSMARLVAALDADEIGIVAVLRELVGEVQADARRRRVRFHCIVDDAEAMLVQHGLVGRAGLRVVDQREACCVGLQRRLPVVAVGERPADLLAGKGRAPRG